MHLQLSRKPIHEPSELDLLVVEATDYIAELLLGRNHDPVFAATLYAKALHNRLQIEHLLNVALALGIDRGVAGMDRGALDAAVEP